MYRYSSGVDNAMDNIDRPDVALQQTLATVIRIRAHAHLHSGASDEIYQACRRVVPVVRGQSVMHATGRECLRVIKQLAGALLVRAVRCDERSMRCLCL
jgi:hypothetical protein